jgi:hypothetical protein
MHLRLNGTEILYHLDLWRGCSAGIGLSWEIHPLVVNPGPPLLKGDFSTVESGKLENEEKNT